ncbi:uncharacterized protein N7496_008466 [Penicillium cataractarum]|uniref:Uncharacterized protein n=1 Tax=Penicillium cataractarum TaxID=2100454 RepID=A0A9W9RYT3_9EURO|nr:uncharacterized protein N7496_008466 [Penicillium cataractarum]KAJ5368706.1 hypothetical protein N7496_008466 [Penicillium cataractarum]
MTSTRANLSPLTEDEIDRFLRIRREICDKLISWNVNLISDPRISGTLSDNLRQLMEQDFTELTTLHNRIRESWIMSDADRNGWNTCWQTKADRIREYMQTLTRDLANPPAYYHQAELAEMLSILAVCIGHLHYRKQVDEHVRQMRDAAQEMNHRRATQGYFGPHLGIVWDELFELMNCGCDFCWTGY